MTPSAIKKRDELALDCRSPEAFKWGFDAGYSARDSENPFSEKSITDIVTLQNELREYENRITTLNNTINKLEFTLQEISNEISKRNSSRRKLNN